MKIAADENALNELNMLCREAADHFDLAATLVHDERLAAIFRDLARERRTISDTLVDHVRTIGLPQFPDPEKEGLEHLITRVKAVLSLDERTTLIHERQRTEQELARKIIVALQQELPDPIREFLEQTALRIAQAQRRLVEALRKIP